MEGWLDEYTVTEKASFMTYCSTLSFANSITNPVVYAVKVTAVRARFRAVFCRRGHRVQASEDSMTQAVTAPGSDTGHGAAKVKVDCMARVTEISDC